MSASNGGDVPSTPSVPRSFREIVWDFALEQDTGGMIVALSRLTDQALEHVLEAAQQLDSLAQDEWERRRAK